MVGRQAKAQALRELCKTKVLLKDGPYGTMIQNHGLDEAGYRGSAFQDVNKDQKGNNDLLNLSRPDIIRGIAQAYVEAGADVLATNTFNANAISQSDYGTEAYTAEINRAAGRILREVVDEANEVNPEKPRFVVGAIGPTNKTLSVSPDVENPGHREVSFDDMKAIYREQVDALLEGGVDFILIETIFDTLNAKAALMAVAEAGDALGEEIPVMVSLTITDMAGRNLSGQTPEAFWYSVRHVSPLTVGLNCSFGARELRPHLAAMSKLADTLIMAYPNAGLPNDLGAYDESPDETAELVSEWLSDNLVNIIGGCCGTTPEHIRALHDVVNGQTPRLPAHLAPSMRLSGLEAVTL
ncbi:MAG: homocysteine S-methyltransferase family protein [Sphingomonadales bacterium]|jgi:5-methyltetrahydrofolate--homocysteine methyltransferase